MTTTLLLLIIVAAVAVLGVGIALGLARGRKEFPPPSTLDAITEESIEHPESHLEDADAGEPAPEQQAAVDTLERPESPQGRLVRLRARLARSQGSLGKGLLAVLGRSTLDDAAWEEIEDTLLAADVGVGATTA